MMHTGNNENSQDVELNLAPIIDCFTVLVTFLLATTTFLSIGTLDAGIAASGETLKDQNQIQLQVSVTLNHDKSIKITLSGKNSTSDFIQSKDQKQWNYEQLKEKLINIKNQHSNTDTVTLIADNPVEYADIIQALDQIRKIYPSVVLGGF